MTPRALITLSLLYKHTPAFITLCARTPTHTHSEKTAASLFSPHVNASSKVFFFLNMYECKLVLVVFQHILHNFCCVSPILFYLFFATQVGVQVVEFSASGVCV